MSSTADADTEEYCDAHVIQEDRTTMMPAASSINRGAGITEIRAPRGGTGGRHSDFGAECEWGRGNTA